MKRSALPARIEFFKGDFRAERSPYSFAYYANQRLERLYANEARSQLLAITSQLYANELNTRKLATNIYRVKQSGLHRYANVMQIFKFPLRWDRAAAAAGGGRNKRINENRMKGSQRG